VGDEKTSTRAAACSVVIPGDIHATVRSAGRFVVYPERLAVVHTAIVGASSRAPRLAIGRGPQADALTVAALRQVAGEELAQLGVENHDRISYVKAMTVIKRRR